MNILVIKQTSLGDVLHSTPHIRAIKAKFPHAHLTVLTAKDSAEIYANNPCVDRLVLFDYARFKQYGLRSPRSLILLIKQTLAKLKQRNYDLAFDLQGLLRSVIFLYSVTSKRKLVKGRWLGLTRFRNKNLHAIEEMNQVLSLADISVESEVMEFARPPETQAALIAILETAGVAQLVSQDQSKPFVVISPFTRWASKDWPLENFIQAATMLCRLCPVFITGTSADRGLIESALAAKPENIINLAGKLSLAELAELMSRTGLVISGDSFPMHLACAVQTPLLALFGPTDEHKTGPKTQNSLVLRPEDCQRCDQPNCAKACLRQITVETVVKAAKANIRI